MVPTLLREELQCTACRQRAQDRRPLDKQVCDSVRHSDSSEATQKCAKRENSADLIEKLAVESL